MVEIGREPLSLKAIVTEPIDVVGGSMREMSDGQVEGLKASLLLLLANPNAGKDLEALQDALSTRSPRSTRDDLMRADRAHLDMLVAIRTGIQAFLHPEVSISNRILVDIFLQVRCRNVVCQTPLPADDCSCSVCSYSKGFCNLCMCMTCAKFDFDANTCRWVGCDFCMHWCHTDCAIRSGYVGMGTCIRRAQECEEMQFRCMACGHTSELFGFVKDVFGKCGDVWDAAAVLRELDCVRRIFHGSSDARGQALHAYALGALADLKRRVPHGEVLRSTIRFFREYADWSSGGTFPVASLGTTTDTGTEMSGRLQVETSAQLTAFLRDAVFKMEARAEENTVGLKRARQALEKYDQELMEKQSEREELLRERAMRLRQMSEMEEMVKVKGREANELQMHAENRRHEAKALERMIEEQRSWIEKEFSSRYYKLKLDEAESERRQLRDVVTSLERANVQPDTAKLGPLHGLLTRVDATTPVPSSEAPPSLAASQQPSTGGGSGGRAESSSVA